MQWFDCGICFCLQRRLVYEQCQDETNRKDLPGSVMSAMTATEMENVMEQMERGDVEELVKKLNKDEQLLKSELVGSN